MQTYLQMVEKSSSLAELFSIAILLVATINIILAMILLQVLKHILQTIKRSLAEITSRGNFPNDFDLWRFHGSRRSQRLSFSLFQNEARRLTVFMLAGMFPKLPFVGENFQTSDTLMRSWLEMTLQMEME
jgi:hypothetical protein